MKIYAEDGTIITEIDGKEELHGRVPFKADRKGNYFWFFISGKEVWEGDYNRVFRKNGSGFTSPEQLKNYVVDLQTPNDRETRAQFFLLGMLGDQGLNQGVTSATGDYRNQPLELYVSPPSGHEFVINRMLSTLVDDGGIDSGRFGDNILSANIDLEVHNSQGLIGKLNGDRPIQKTGDWVKYAHDLKEYHRGNGDEYVSIRWTFGNAGKGLRLIGDEGEKLLVRCSGDFRRLTEHVFNVQGYISKSPYDSQ